MTKRIFVKGAVQGIGYRPFISEKATEYGLCGYVKNCGASVMIVVSGTEGAIDSFISMLTKEVPDGGFVLSVEADEMQNEDDEILKADPDLADGFTIIESSDLDLSKELPVFLPDIGICHDCMNEMLDQSNRRYRYPLISCAVCGPRMSILNSLPYDRERTTMEDFEMCSSCREDYGIGRRKYAQTISCHNCGPQMALKVNNSIYTDLSDDSITAIEGEEAVQRAIRILENGGIIGLKGISGYQLVCRPDSDIAKRLRLIKGRENKPFAIMFSTSDLVKEYADVSEKEEELLNSSARPIVLVKRKSNDFDDEVIKQSRYIGAFLPSAGIHRLLTDELGPLIVTSANKSDQPMIIDDDIFLSAFMSDDTGVDAVLFHKRRINMAQDDSVMFVIEAGGIEYPQFIRRARGFAPLPILIEGKNTACADINKSDSENTEEDANQPLSVLAVGGDLKSCFCFGKRDRLIPSQYIGDLEDYGTNRSFLRLIKDYQRIFEFEPNMIVHDLHPMYMSTKIAKDFSLSLKNTDNRSIKTTGLQHHFAHNYSVMAEYSLESAIGVSFDGTGYGTDGKIWGGEFVCCDANQQERLGHLSYVKLAGGDTAPKNARNVALCYLYACQKQGLLKANDDISEYLSHCNEIGDIYRNSSKLLFAALDNNINTFETSSMGRLFDAVAALLGICNYNSYEGEAAIMLEKSALEFADAADSADNKLDYPHFEFSYYEENDNMKSRKAFETSKACQSSFVADQTALFADIYQCNIEGKYTTGSIAYGFHMAVTDLIVRGCQIMHNQSGLKSICLSGGVFNNRLLLKSSAEALLKKGFDVYWNRKVPLGDGGISTGQTYYGLIRK